MGVGGQRERESWGWRGGGLLIDKQTTSGSASLWQGQNNSLLRLLPTLGINHWQFHQRREEVRDGERETEREREEGDKNQRNRHLSVNTVYSICSHFELRIVSLTSSTLCPLSFICRHSRFLQLHEYDQWEVNFISSVHHTDVHYWWQVMLRIFHNFQYDKIQSSSNFDKSAPITSFITRSTVRWSTWHHAQEVPGINLGGGNFTWPFRPSLNAKARKKMEILPELLYSNKTSFLPLICIAQCDNIIMLVRLGQSCSVHQASDAWGCVYNWRGKS